LSFIEFRILKSWQSNHYWDKRQWHRNLRRPTISYIWTLLSCTSRDYESQW